MKGGKKGKKLRRDAATVGEEYETGATDLGPSYMISRRHLGVGGIVTRGVEVRGFCKKNKGLGRGDRMTGLKTVLGDAKANGIQKGRGIDTVRGEKKNGGLDTWPLYS